MIDLLKIMAFLVIWFFCGITTLEFHRKFERGRMSTEDEFWVPVMWPLAVIAYLLWIVSWIAGELGRELAEICLLIRSKIYKKPIKKNA